MALQQLNYFQDKMVKLIIRLDQVYYLTRGNKFEEYLPKNWKFKKPRSKSIVRILKYYYQLMEQR